MVVNAPFFLMLLTHFLHQNGIFFHCSDFQIKKTGGNVLICYFSIVKSEGELFKLFCEFLFFFSLAFFREGTFNLGQTFSVTIENVGNKILLVSVQM